MRRHAKASSAGSTSGRAVPSLAGLTLTLALVALLAFVPAAVAAPKSVVNIIGETGTGDGQFAASIAGLAVNDTGAGGAGAGDVYVVDRGSNRVQQFTAGGSFVRAFGFNVGGAGVHVCASLCAPGTVSNAASGMSAPQGIAVNQETGQVFVTDQGNRRVDVFSAAGVFEGAFGWGADTGAAAFEFCTTASACQAPAAAGGAAGQFGAAIGYPAVDPSTGNVYVADITNRRIAEFAIEGSPATGASFVRAFGWNVDSSGGSGELEVCTTACQQAPATGSANGQFGTGGATRVAVDSNGTIYAVDPSNFRVQVFDAAITAATPFAAAVVSGTNTATAPGNVAVDPETDDVYVAKAFPASAGSPPASSAEQRVLQLDDAGALLDTHMANAGIGNVNGLAFSPLGDTPYLSSTTGQQRVFVLGPAVAPVPVINPVTNVGTTEATLAGTVNPQNGFQTIYHFEYKLLSAPDVPASWTAVPVPGGDAGSGGSPNPVSEDIEGLEPNTAYQARLIASRPFNPISEVSSIAQFTTQAAVPDITGVRAVDINETSVKLAGKVDPNSQATNYRFEYGTDAGYGQSTALTPIGSGPDFVVVVEPLDGLQPNTTYHFKLVATNPTGSNESTDFSFTTDTVAACPNESLRIAHNARFLPDCRAWEMVSPADKAGNSVNNIAAGLAMAGGGSVIYPVMGAFPGAVGNVLPDPYRSVRGDGSWSTNHAGLSVGTQFGLLGPFFRTVGLSDDGSKIVLTSRLALTPDAWEGVQQALPLYIRGTEPGAEPQLVTPAPISGTLGAYSSTFVWGDEDFSHILFDTTAELTPDASPLADNAVKLYKWEEGTVTLESVVGGNGVSATGGGGSSSAIKLAETALSNDGEVSWFTAAPGASGSVYRREGGETVRVNAEENSGEVVPAGGAEWRQATPDGSKALFISNQKLLAADTDTTADLYLYTHSPDPENEDVNLTLVSSEADGPTLGIFGASADLSRVYFAAGTNDVANLYLWEQGTLHHLGVVTADQVRAGGTPASWTASNSGNLNARRAVSADGSAFMLWSSAQLDAEHDNGGSFQVYLWERSTEAFTCISCPPSGAPASGDSHLQNSPGIIYQGSIWSRPHNNLSADGSRAFFISPDRLVGADGNDVDDVYVWQNGRRALISSGRSDERSVFMAADESGDNAFFQTFDRLTGWDPDRLGDIYVARVGGGFEEPPPAPSICLGDGCRGAGSVAAPPLGAGTAVFEGAGNPKPQGQSKPRRCGRNQVRRGSRCVAKRTLARRACAKRKGKARQRCIRSQARRLDRLQARQLGSQKRALNTNRRTTR